MLTLQPVAPTPYGRKHWPAVANKKILTLLPSVHLHWFIGSTHRVVCMYTVMEEDTPMVPHRSALCSGDQDQRSACVIPTTPPS